MYILLDRGYRVLSGSERGSERGSVKGEWLWGLRFDKSSSTKIEKAATKILILSLSGWVLKLDFYKKVLSAKKLRGLIEKKGLILKSLKRVDHNLKKCSY